MQSYHQEWQGFKDCDALEIVPRKKGMKVLGSVTHNEYKTVDGKLLKASAVARAQQGVEAPRESESGRRPGQAAVSDGA